METLLQQLQESLLSHCRPVQVAFHLYEILSEAGYEDDMINECIKSPALFLSFWENSLNVQAFTFASWEDNMNLVCGLITEG